jgi:hypothetical protein
LNSSFFREHRLLADKSLADVVEALIGCFLLRTGQQNTLAVMARMGVDLTPANTLVSFDRNRIQYFESKRIRIWTFSAVL